MQAKDARSRPCSGNAERESWAQADQRRSKQIKNWTYDDDSPRWPPVNLANHSFDGARSGSPQWLLMIGVVLVDLVGRPTDGCDVAAWQARDEVVQI